MGSVEKSAFPKVLKEFKRWGLLLLTDARLPNVASLVAGEPVRGSWWAHPQAHAIFRVASRLDEHPDVTVAKLVSGKVTYIHRKLWPALVALGSAREAWQMQGLPRMGRALLARVLKEGRLRTDRLSRWRVPPGSAREGSRGGKSKAVGEAVRELERRLLVHGEEFHTESGAHAKWLESWGHWAKRVGLRGREMTPEQGKKKFAGTLRALNTRYRTGARLPWEETQRGRRRFPRR